METNNEKTVSSDCGRIAECSIEDDAEDYIQPSQPLSFQTCSDSGSTGKNILNHTEARGANSSAFDDTLPFPQSITSTPPGEVSSDFIPTTDNPVKRKLNPHEYDETCKKRLNLDDSSVIKATPDMFATESQLNDTVDVALLKVPDSPSPTQNMSLVPETPLWVNETLESENNDAFPEKLRVLEDISTEESVLDISSNQHPEAAVDEIRKEGMDFGKCDLSQPVLESSGVSSLIRDTTGRDIRNDKRMNTQEIQLDDTIDIDEMGYCDSFSGGEGGAKVTAIPQRTKVEVPLAENRKSTPVGVGIYADDLRFKGVLKNVSDEEIARLQKHSTPENPLSKSLKINESTSSIENGTPPVQDDTKSNEIRFTVYLQVNCQVVTDPVTSASVSKRILSVKELVKREPRAIFLEPNSDSSCKTKRLSSSSYGSVYSDKNELPYALPGRPSPISVTGESSSSSSVDLAKHIQIVERQLWLNEYMIPMAIDEVLPRYIEESKREAHDGKQIGKRKMSVRLRKKSHWSHPLDNVLESSLTEQSSAGSSEVHSRSINKSVGNMEGVDDSEDKCVAAVEDKEPKEENEGVTPVEKYEDNGEEGSLAEGMLVFARWTDKRYYPGKLRCKAKYDRWEVDFDDETEKVIREDFILPLNWVTKGELVFALVGEKYLSGKVAEIIREEGIAFKIELDDTNEEVNVKKSDICLNDVMASIIREKFKLTSKSGPPVKSYEIDFDNVVTGKRVREQRTPVRTAAASLQPGSSTAKKRRLPKSGTEDKTPKEKQTSAQKSVPKNTRSSNRKHFTSQSDDQSGKKGATTSVTPQSKSETKRTTRTAKYETSKSKSKSTREGHEVKEEPTPTPQRKEKSSAKALINEFDELENEGSGNANTRHRKGKQEMSSPVTGWSGKKSVPANQKRRNNS